MQALKNSDVYERMFAFVGADFNAAHSGFLNDWIDDFAKKRLDGGELAYGRDSRSRT